MTVAAVFGYALLTALATGLGALPLLVFRRVPAAWLGTANAVAAGLMGAASWSLVVEGISYGLPRTLLGAAAGAVFILVSSRLMATHEVRWGELGGADARKVLLIVAVMTIHSVTEGIGVGVAFGGGATLGATITAAIAVHNIPEGLAISLVMVPRGTSVLKASLWSVFSSLPQPLLAVPAFLLVAVFEPVLPAGLGFAAGAMLWMIASELLPEARRHTSRLTVVFAFAVAAVAFLLFQRLL